MTHTKRPTQITDEMATPAAQAVCRELVQSHGFDDDEINEMVADILSVTRFDRRMDGYQLAKELDRCKYWDCTLDIAEVLDGFSSECDVELRKLEKEWGVENPMEAPLAPGTILAVRGGVGEIIGIAEYSVHSYAVKVPDIKNGYLVVRFEDAHVV